ncbi:MAG TPA: hypothetical protein VFH94_03575 [Streptomyces sp.]|nr:hypothetical protein [Streptomyces sp.]
MRTPVREAPTPPACHGPIERGDGRSFVTILNLAQLRDFHELRTTPEPCGTARTVEDSVRQDPANLATGPSPST